MTLQELTSKMKEGAASKSSFGNTVKFSTDQGVIYIDGTASPPDVSNDDKAADDGAKQHRAPHNSCTTETPAG